MLKIQILLHVSELSLFKFLMNHVFILERVKMESINAQMEEDEQIANAIQLSLVMLSSLANDSAHSFSSSSKAVSSQLEASATK